MAQFCEASKQVGLGGFFMDHATSGKRLSWGACVSALATVVTLVCGAFEILPHLDPPPDINGSWVIETRTVDTSYSAFRNLDLTYTVQFTQNGSNFRGSGEKTTQNGQLVMGKAHTPISITGAIKGNSIDASFTEDGTERESHGEFHWTLSKGSGTGTFVSTAAQSSGVSSLKPYTAGGR
jgi:hypothetical protein